MSKISRGAAWHEEIWYQPDDVKLQSQLMIHSLGRDGISRFSQDKFMYCIS